MKVLAWGRRLTPEEAASVGAERRELDDLLTSSDIVSIHATLSGETRGFRDGALLIAFLQTTLEELERVPSSEP
jgi:phosphoglycerate dehydrogenase-like enzyme